MIETDKRAGELENLGSLEVPSFRDIYDDIPAWIKEGVDRYFESSVSENNTAAENFDDIHAMDADLCRSVIEECLEYNFEKKKIDTVTLKTVSTTPKDKLFNKLDDQGKVESEGLLGITEEEFCTQCVWQYCNKYLVPRIFTESYTTKGGHFVIHYSGDLSDKAVKDLEKILDDNFDKVCEFFKLSKKGKNNYITEAYIYNDIEFYHLSCFGKKLNDRSTGSYGYRSFYMLSPDKEQKNPYESRIQTALHEFAHSVSYLDQVSREGWTSEGIAEYLSGNKPKGEQIQEALKECPLTEEIFDIMFSDKEHRDVFYGAKGLQYLYMYACTTMDYIINTRKDGNDKIVEIFRNRDPNKSPFDVLGVSKEEFQEGWVKYVTEGDYIKNLSHDTH